MKRILIFLLCAVLIAGLFSGCDLQETPYVPTGDALDYGDGATSGTQTPEDEQPLTFPYYPDRSLNPYLCTDYTNRTLFSLLYQGLFTVDRDYNVSPILCSRFSVSPDMRTYTFYVENAAFSDGTTVTVEDVIASLNAAKAGPYYSGRFQHISSIEQIDETSFLIRLDTPCENLPILLDIPIVKASTVNDETPTATGPYVVEDSLRGKRLRRVSVWWCSASMSVTTPYIPLVEAESPRQIRDQFEYSNVGFVCSNPCSDAYADFRCDYELWDCDNGIMLYLSTHADSEVFSNDAVRSALVYAINRDYLAENYYRGFARSASLPASPYSPYYDAELAAQYAYDRSKLTQALADAGLLWKEVVLLVNREDTLRLRVAKAIAQMLSDCGLNVTILETAYIYCENYLRTGEYDLYLGQTKLSPNMDLTTFFAENGSQNYGGMANMSLYAMNLEALANSGNYYALHRRVMNDGRLVPILFHSYALYSARGLVSDLEPARDHIFYYDLGRTLEDALISD